MCSRPYGKLILKENLRGLPITLSPISYWRRLSNGSLKTSYQKSLKSFQILGKSWSVGRAIDSHFRLFTLVITGTSRTGVLRAVVDRIAVLGLSGFSISEVGVNYSPPLPFLTARVQAVYSALCITTPEDKALVVPVTLSLLPLPVRNACQYWSFADDFAGVPSRPS